MLVVFVNMICSWNTLVQTLEWIILARRYIYNQLIDCLHKGELPGADPGLFQGGLGGNSYIIYKNYIHYNYSHYYFNQQSACKYLLCMKLQPTRYCSCSYYTLVLLYIYTVIFIVLHGQILVRARTLSLAV